MGDDCKNCPENNPKSSRVALRIDNLEEWQQEHDDRYKTREEQRQKDKRGIIISVIVAVIVMILTSIYNTLLVKVGYNAENNSSRMQKYSDQNIEYSVGGRGRTLYDRHNPEVKGGVK
jgi:hypothetical protein